MLSQLREEVSGSAVGRLSGKEQYDEITLGLFEMGVVEFGMFQGHRIGTDKYNQALARKHTLYEDRCEWTCDIASELYRQLIKQTDRVSFEYRFVYRILPNNHVLVGVDERDLQTDERET